MASCRDPYQELEVYLQKAQDEIGKAFEELLQYEERCSSSPYVCNNSEAVLPPPPAFRSRSRRFFCNRFNGKHQDGFETNVNFMSRVCHDGNVVDLTNTSADSYSGVSHRYPLQKSSSYSETASYFSNVGSYFSETECKRIISNGNCTIPHQEKRHVKQLRPSLSFPEGAMDVCLREEVVVNARKNYYDTKAGDFSSSSDVAPHRFQTGTPVSPERQRPCLRQRSFSETLHPLKSSCKDDHYNTFPRPPSNDVNLLSIWADNLVVAIDKSLSEELNDSISSSSPLSEYGFSTTKPSEGSNTPLLNRTNLSMTSEINTNAAGHYSYPHNTSNSTWGNLKYISPSPDSGIGQIYDTPDVFEDAIGICEKDIKDRNKNVSLSLEIKMDVQNEVHFDIADCITPPPPEFEDKNGKYSFPHRSYKYDKDIQAQDMQQSSKQNSCVKALGKRDAETQVSRQILRASISDSTNPDNILYDLDNRTKEIHRQARVVPLVSMELEDCATITTTCVISEAPWKGAIFSGVRHSENVTDTIVPKRTKDDSANESRRTSSKFDALPVSDVDSNDVVGEGVHADSTCSSYTPAMSCTLPKQVSRTREPESFSSLPRDAGRPQSAPLSDSSQRSASSSAVSSISQVSMDELAAFMWKVKKSTYHPPPRMDASINVKNDSDEILSEEPNCDAVTQTSPVVLSRSSSFTWVTECDCSEWDSSNAPSGSEGSMVVFSTKNSSPENNAAETSSPSFSTDDDDVPQNSCSSSLYLSACSEAVDSSSNDSFRDVARKQDLETHSKLKMDTCSSPLAHSANASPCFRSLSSSGTLVYKAEESVLNESFPFSTPPSSQSNSPSEEQPSSLPILASLNSRSEDDDTYRHQPIEANVLVVNELNFKSVSAPVLQQKQNITSKNDASSSAESSPRAGSTKKGESPNHQSFTPQRAHSAKELNELQAIEACNWLRAAGFPQYAQMYEDNLFPVDISTVQKDHAFLHPDSMQSLYRRLNTLNRCARTKFDTAHRTSVHIDDSDEEEECALSENWEFQRLSRRWSRVCSPTQPCGDCSNSGIHDHSLSPKPSPHSTPNRKYLTPEGAYTSSHDSVFVDEQHSSPDSIRRTGFHCDDHCLPVNVLREGGNSPGSSSGSGGALSLETEDMSEKTLRRQGDLHRGGSDKIKEGAKAIFRRMESLKGKRKRKNVDTKRSENIQNSFHNGANSGTEESSCSSLASSPMLSRACAERIVNNDSISNGFQGGTPQLKHRKKGFALFRKGDNEASAHSDSECPTRYVSESWKETASNDIRPIERYKFPRNSGKSVSASSSPIVRKEAYSGKCDHISGGTDMPSNGEAQLLQPKNNTAIYFRCPHLLGDVKISKRASHYDNYPAPLVVFNNACVENLDKEYNQSENAESYGTSASEQENREEEIIIINDRRDSGVGSSLTRVGSFYPAPWHSFPRQTSTLKFDKSSHKIIPITSLNAPQMLVLRKFSLLRLTTLMEKFSPTSRTGWSWAMPKFMRKIRSPDYRDKAVFGVPLLLVLQRSGEPLPHAIQSAIQYLRKTSLESTGLFRKSGVRSRIQKLRALTESDSDKIDFEDQQPYDVADLLKQYFRELPEALLTNKLTETFIAIFQYIPKELRLEAIQAAVMLIPDENREVLYCLLSFLQEVCQHSGENQMTATNVSVCFAPSLFQLSANICASSSPRRRKTVGAPDLKELNENRAAYECLSTMVTNYKQLCTVSESLFHQSRLPCMESYEPAHLGELSHLVCQDAYGWKTYVDCCVQALLKEVKEKYKGWENVPHSDGIELSCKKVGDGYPVRLWKASTEVEAPPTELLNRVLRERQVWDSSCFKWRVIQTLEKQAEVFQFVCKALPPYPPCDYCVVRAWKTDLPKGACILIEASIEHPDAKLMVDGAVRALILASRFLIEPCGSGKSRVTQFARIDCRGRSPEWYNRAYGYICSLNLMKLRESFSHTRAVGPETKV